MQTTLFTTFQVSLVLESLKPLCTSLLMISAFTFVRDVSPLTSLASVEGVFGASYFGFGRGCGGLAGGLVVAAVGPRLAMRYMALGAGAATFGYGVLVVLKWLKKRKIKCKNEHEV